jgi:hypothetical protein
LCLGVDVKVDPNQADSKPDDSEYIESLGMQKIRLPNEADFLFAYAAVPGSIFNLCLYMCTSLSDQFQYSDYSKPLNVPNPL